MKKSKRKNELLAKTNEAFLHFVKAHEQNQMDLIRQSLFEIRTGNLREVLSMMETEHQCFRLVVKCLLDQSLSDCYPEALYNLAVIFGDKRLVQNYFENIIMNALFQFYNSPDEKLVFLSAWCLFGVCSSDVNFRNRCFRRGLLQSAINHIINYEGKIREMSSKLVYGSFQLKPLPPDELIQSLFQNITSLLHLPSDTLKYMIWAFQFASTDKSFTGEEMVEFLPLLKNSERDPELIIPILILFSHLSQPDFANDILFHFLPPLNHIDSKVRLQTCRILAGFIQNPTNIDAMFDHGIYNKIIDILHDDENVAREKAINLGRRGFGL
jgi:hypothetical protein